MAKGTSNTSVTASIGIRETRGLKGVSGFLDLKRFFQEIHLKTALKLLSLLIVDGKTSVDKEAKIQKIF